MSHSFLLQHKLISSIAIIIVLLIAAAVGEFLYIKHDGSPVPAPNIPRNVSTTGSGPSLTYVVMGDSTSIGQGSDYASSIGPQTAGYLAERYTISMTNVGISGATTQEVYQKELPKAATIKPDLVLISIGANDVTHFSKLADVQTALVNTVKGLRSANGSVKIVITGSPAMSTVPRFPWPVNKIMGSRVHSINALFERLATDNGLVFAPIAHDTEPAFSGSPELFAADNFHPTAAGYAEWLPTLRRALDVALPPN